MRENTFRAVLAAAGAAVAAYLEILLVPVIIAAIVMLCDYISGVAAAWANAELSSRTGIVGIVKKVAYALIIVVGIAVDWVIRTAAQSFGADIGSFSYFALLVIIWLIINECISILENVRRLGAPVPAFLLRLTAKLKSEAEAKGGGAVDD